MKVLDSTRFGFIFAATILLVSTVNVDAATCQGDMAIVTQHDLDLVRNCKTYGGNIVIDNCGASELKMNGIELLEGDLTVTGNNGLQSISFPRLQGINGALKFSNNKLLNTIDLKQLFALRSLEVSVHPALNELKFPAGLSQADKIKIADTTCTKIEGFKLQSTKEIEMTNNIYLKTLSFGNLTSVGSILVSANSPALKLDLDNIGNVSEATFRNVASISLGSLKKISGDISFIQNSFDTLDLPSTTDITGTLTLTDNMKLTNLSMAKLSHLGGALALGGNVQLSSVNAFPNLQQVDGTLDLTGGFDEVQFPALADVRGGLNVQTSSNTFSCDGMNKLKNGVIKGNSFMCKSAVAKPKSTILGKDGKPISGGGAGGSSESAAAVSYQQPGLLMALGVAFAYYANI